MKKKNLIQTLLFVLPFVLLGACSSRQETAERQTAADAHAAACSEKKDERKPSSHGKAKRYKNFETKGLKR